MVKGGINKEVFFNFLRCNKLALYIEKFAHLKNEQPTTSCIDENEFQFKEVAYKLIYDSEKEVCTKILRNKIIKINDGETVSADVILKRAENAALKFKKETILIEIVNSSNLLDGPELAWLAYKIFLIKKANYPIDKIWVIKVDRKYEKNGTLTDGFLFIRDVTLKIQQFLPNIPPLLARIKNILGQGSLIDKQKGIFCLEPNPCPFRNNCWKDMPCEKETAFEIEDMQPNTKFHLFWDETFTFESIPRKRLDKRQWIQVKHGMRNVPLIKKDKINEWTTYLNAPAGIWYLDIMACHPVEPFCDMARAYASTPFQFNVKYQFPDSTNFTDSNFVGIDTRPSEMPLLFFKNLTSLLNLNRNAKIVVFNLRKIENILNNLAKWHPELYSQIKDIKSRLVDLMEVFYECWYYLPCFKGAYHLRKIAPFMIKGLDFTNSPIHDNSTAKNIFLKSVYKQAILSDKDKMHLKEYSGQNSLAMMEIVNFLRQL